MTDAPTKKEMVAKISAEAPGLVEDLLLGKIRSVQMPYMVPKKDFDPSASVFEWDPYFKQYFPAPHSDIMTITLTKEDFQ